MKCPSCKHTLPKSFDFNDTKICPICSVNFLNYIKKNCFDDVKSILRVLYQLCGYDIFNSKEKLIAYLKDFAPNRQQDIQCVKAALVLADANVLFKQILKKDNVPDLSKEEQFKLSITKTMLPQEVADFIFDAFVYAVDVDDKKVDILSHIAEKDDIEDIEKRANKAIAVLSYDKTSLVFYYDDKDHSSEGTVYKVGNGSYHPWTGNINKPNTTLKTIKTDASFHNYEGLKDLNCYFEFCSAITNASLFYFNTKNVIDMQEMFFNCSSLTSLEGLKNWDTSNVTTMRSIFNRCSSLASLDGLDNWDTSNVSNMQAMFTHCSSLASLEGLRNWSTSNVTSILAELSRHKFQFS